MQVQGRPAAAHGERLACRVPGWGTTTRTKAEVSKGQDPPWD